MSRIILAPTVTSKNRCCAELGGPAITPIKGLGEETSYVVVRDPSGAVLALSGHTDFG